MKNLAIPKRIVAVLLVFIIAFSAISVNLTSVLADTVKPSEPFVFAKLDGSEWNVVHPGMNNDYHSMNLDRKLNFVGSGTETPNINTVFTSVTVSRTDMGEEAADLTGYDVLSFMLTVEDNGAFESYRNYISIELDTNAGTVEIPQADVLAALSVVKPGTEVKVRLPLSGVGEDAVKSVKKFIFSVSGSTCDKNLGIKIKNMVAEVLPEDVLLIDDEAGETRKPAVNTVGEQVAVGERSLKITTSSNIIIAGFFGSPALEPKDIKSLTNNGTDGAVRFWMYVEKVSVLDSIKQRQASGNKVVAKIGDCHSASGNYYVWDNWIDSVTEDGWNEVVLPFADCTVEGTAPDLTKIDTLNFKLPNGSASIEMYIDHLRVSADPSVKTEPPGQEEPGGEIIPPATDRVAIIDDEAGEGGYFIETNVSDEIAKVGTHSLKVNTYEYEGWIIRAGFWGSKALPKKDISAVTENGTSGALHFWLYIEDIADLEEIKALTTPNIIKIGDCQNIDGNYFRWENWLDQVTVSGWNEITLKFADCGIEANQPDATKIDTLYMKLPDGSPSITIYIDDLAVIATEDEGPAKPKTAVIAKLDGSEWPICHPGLSGQYNNPDYDATHLDRRISFIPNGDVKTYINVLRDAAGMEPIDASKHNVLTFMLTVEDNGAWETYKDKLNISVATAQGDSLQIASADVQAAFKNVVVGQPTKITISLRSIGSKNLSAVNGLSFYLGEGFSDKILHITVTDVCAEYTTDFPDLSPDPVLPDDDDKEETKEIVFAKLDGSEWPIVHPGLNSDYHAMNFDRTINFTPRTDNLPTEDKIYNFVNVIRSEVSSYKPVSFTDCNVVTFNVFIEDNGAWADYKNKITISFVDSNGVNHPISSADVSKGFESVVPGKWCEVKISLGSWHKGELNNLNQFSLGLSDGKSDKDLHIRMIRIAAAYDKSFADVAEIPSNDDPLLLLNDEYGEKAWPASISNDISKVGKKSYKATTFVTEAGFNEGWLIRMGFWGESLERTFNIKDVTKNGTAGAIRFWIYTDDYVKLKELAEKNTGSYCRIGSSHELEEDCFIWQGWTSQVIKNGWNQIVLPFSRARKQGTPDLTKIISFTLKLGEGPVADLPVSTVYLDDIRVSADDTTALPISYEPTIKGAKMFQPFEEMFGLNRETVFTSFEMDLEEKTQGMSSLKFSVDTGNFVWVYRTGEGNEVDSTGYNALEFDLYVSDPDFFEFAGGAIELTSSGTWDQNEISWGLGDLNLNEGWNHVKLSFDFASQTVDWKGESDVDFTKINFLRIYTGTAQNYIGKEITFRIDNMCFTKSGEVKIEKSVITTNNTGYELYLTAKPDVIPAYGELVVETKDMSIIPEIVAKEFEADNKNTIILDPTFYKDTREYLFSDTVTVHLKKDNLTSMDEFYLYRLDVNGSFRKLSRIDNKAKKEIIWDEPTRLATYIISDVLLDDEVLGKLEQNLASANDGSNKANVSAFTKMALAIGISVAVLAVLAGGAATAIILIKKKRKAGK